MPIIQSPSNDEYENKKINSGFRYGESKLEPVKPQVNFVAKEIEKDTENKIVCQTCTDNFFRIFFKEQIQDQQIAMSESDPIMQDIFNKKVFMKYDIKQGIYYCNNCGDKVVKYKNNLINSPKKILKIAGIDPRQESNEVQNFTAGVDRNKTDEYELNYNIEPQIESFENN